MPGQPVPQQAHQHPTRREWWPDDERGRDDGETHHRSLTKTSSRGRPRHSPPAAAARTVPFALSRRDDAFLRAVATYHFLTAEQLTRLLFRPGSLAYVRAKLKRLADAGYLDRLHLPTATAGNAPFVFSLAAPGIGYLTETGEETGAKWFRPVEQHERSYLFLSHTLAVNDFLIAAHLLSRTEPRVVLATMRHERDLRREPVTVTTAAGERLGIVPDGWVDLHIAGESRLCLALELDRGTVEERAWKRKLRGLIAYADGPYQQQFGTPSLTILIATTTGPSRCTAIRRWCEQVLHEVHREADADVFLLTSLPEGAPPDPQTLFLRPVWQQPLRPDLLPLISLPLSPPSVPSPPQHA